ncbi:MAG: hypothetical protein AB8F74_20080, partial [Saprospiraceae bacterium]
MRRNILPALILFLFTFSTAQAQLQKGDFFTQPSATLEYNFDGPHQVERFNQNLFLNGYWMVSKRIMVGGGLLLDNGN